MSALEGPHAMTDSMFDLTGRLALLTGSGRGIGFSLSRGLSVARAEIVLNDLDTDTLRAAAAELGREGARAHWRASTSPPRTR
jgi:gluconate 5-dehydrogenase